MVRFVALSLFVAATAFAVEADTAPRPPTPQAAPPLAAADWWKSPSPLAEAADPLGGRRAPPASPQIPRKLDASYYRLWGLFPLQSQVVRQNEAVLELWIRPQLEGREAVVRVTVRDDGRSFVQARAGFGCCAPSILRRVDIDEELTPAAADRFSGLARDPLWRAAEETIADPGDGSVEGLCLGGVSYDLYLVRRDEAKHLRRDCDDAEIGEAAPLISPILAAAMGRDPRFDAVFPKGAGFAAQIAEYRALLASGGKLVTPKVR